MGDQDDLSVVAGLLGQLPKPDADLLGAGLQLGGGGEVLAGLGLVVPAGAEQGEVDAVGELGPQGVRVGADVAGQDGDLLGLGQRDDLLPGLGDGREGAQAGVQGAPHGRGHQVRDLVVRREPFAELVALRLAQRREERVLQLLVLLAEVVEALRVAHEVDHGCHGGSCMWPVRWIRVR